MKRLLGRQLVYGSLLLVTMGVVQCSKKGSVTPDPVPSPVPVLTSASPTRGIVGDALTITGKNLDNADKIIFNGVTSTIVQNTGTTITSVVPPGATVGNNKITVHNAGGTSNEISFEVLKTPISRNEPPPSLIKTIPSSGYTESPVLIYGDNLSSIVEVTFNDKPAVVYTNNKTVITTNIPKDLQTGTNTIKVRTLTGITTMAFQVLGPPPGGTPFVNFSIVPINIPPPDYVASISNDWALGLLSSFEFDTTTHTGTFVDVNSDTSGNFNEFAITGRYEYYFDKTLNYNTKNYIEIINHRTGDTLAGQFSSKFVKPCILQMVLISSKTGHIIFNTFDVRSNFPDTQCEE